MFGFRITASLGWVLLLSVTCSAKSIDHVTIEKLKALGASNCNRAYSVGRERWTGGSEGLKLLAEVPTDILILNIHPIDGAPLDADGIRHLAKSKPTRIFRFYHNSIDDAGLIQLIDLLNQRADMKVDLQIRRADISDRSVEALKNAKHVSGLKLIETQISGEGKRRLEERYGEKLQYEPRRPR